MVATTPRMPTTDVQTELATVNNRLAFAEEWKAKLDAEVARLEAERAKVPKRGDHHQQLHGEALDEALAQVHAGVKRAEGVSLLISLTIAGQPGLDAISAEIPELKKEAKDLKRQLGRWPDEATTHPYRFKGSDGLAFFDGRALEAGDVVQLNRSQAANWADRYEPVEKSD